MKTIKVFVKLVPLSEADFSDNADPFKKIESEIDTATFIKSLSQMRRRAVEGLMMGKTINDLSNELKLAPSTVYYHCRQIRKLLENWQK